MNKFFIAKIPRKYVFKYKIKVKKLKYDKKYF